MKTYQLNKFAGRPVQNHVGRTVPNIINKTPFKLHNILGTFSAVDVANELGLSPKLIRRRIRNLCCGQLPKTVKEGHWVFNSSDKELVFQLLA